MSASGWSLSPTQVGPCGIVWGAGGLLGVLLPERDEAETRERLRRRHPDAVEAVPPPEVAGVIAKIVALLAGEKIDFPRYPARYLGRPGFRAARLRGCATDRARRDPDLWRHRPAGRERRGGAGGRPSARAQSLADHRALPSGARSIRPHGRLLGSGRGRHQAPHPVDRGAAHAGAARAVRSPAACRQAGAPRVTA